MRLFCIYTTNALACLQHVKITTPNPYTDVAEKARGLTIMYYNTDPGWPKGIGHQCLCMLVHASATVWAPVLRLWTHNAMNINKPLTTKPTSGPMEKQDLDTDTDTDMDTDICTCTMVGTGRTHTVSFSVGQKLNICITCSWACQASFLESVEVKGHVHIQ